MDNGEKDELRKLPAEVVRKVFDLSAGVPAFTTNTPEVTEDMRKKFLERFSQLLVFEPLSEKVVGQVVERMRTRGDSEERIQGFLNRQASAQPEGP